MGAQSRGSDAGFALFEEDTFGQDPAIPDGQKLYLKQFGIKKTQGTERDETITGGRGVAKGVPGNIDVGGPLNGNLSGQGFGTLLKHMMGVINTTGAGPYSHVLTIGDLPVGLTLELDNGLALAGSDRYMKYNGCRVASASFTFKSSGFVDCSFTMMGANGVPSATPLDATVTDNGHTAFKAVSAVLEEGGAVFAHADEVTITIDNELDGDGYLIGSGGARATIPEGQSLVSGSISGILTPEGQAIINKGVSRIDSSLKVTVKEGDGLGTAGNESCEFLVQQLAYELETSDVNGPAGRPFTASFQGHLSGADLGLQITYKNALTTI